MDLKISIFSPGKKERQILRGIKEHLQKVRESVNYLYMLVSNNMSDEYVEKILRAETEADEIHRRLGIEIAEGAFFGGIREDILNLMEEIDNIADSAKDSARFIKMKGNLEEGARSFLSSERMLSFVSCLVSSVDALSDLISSLEVSKSSALSKVHIVEEYEEKADAMKDSLLEELFSKSGSISPLTTIQLRDFIFSADNIADSAEDASDVILVMIAKGYG